MKKTIIILCVSFIAIAALAQKTTSNGLQHFMDNSRN